MASLIAGIWAIFDPDRPLPDGTGDLPALDAGGEELLAGFAEALSVRSTIQLALGIIMGRIHGTAAEAYVQLRLHAADAGTSLRPPLSSKGSPGAADHQAPGRRDPQTCTRRRSAPAGAVV